MLTPMPMSTESDTTSFYSDLLFSGNDRKDPKKVGAHFEAIFYSLMFKEMRESKLAEDPFSSSSMKQVEEMLHQELALKLGAQGDLGITEALEREVSSFSENAGASKGLLKG